MSKSQIAFRLERTKIEQFKEKAKQEGKSQTAIIDQLIAGYLEESEESESSGVTEEGQKEVRKEKKTQVDELDRRLTYLEHCFFKEGKVANDSKEEEKVEKVEKVANDSKEEEKVEKVANDSKEEEKVEKVAKDSKEEEKVEEEEEEEEGRYEKIGDWFPDNELFRMVLEKEDEPDIEILWGKHVNHDHNPSHYNWNKEYLEGTGLVDNDDQIRDAFCFPPNAKNIEKKRKRNEGHGVSPEVIVERIKGLESTEMLFDLLNGKTEFKTAGVTDPEKLRIIDDLERGYWFDRDLQRFFRYSNETLKGARIKNLAPIERGEKYQS